MAPWPTAGEVDPVAESDLSLITNLIRQVRAIRSEYRVEPGRFISASIAAGPRLATLVENREIIDRLARLKMVELAATVSDPPPDSVVVLVDAVSVYLPLGELADVASERMRLEKELAEAERGHSAVASKLANVDFVSRAPKAVVERERARGRELGERIVRLRERVDTLGPGR